MDLYKLLGIKRKATKKEIKNAYRSAAQKYHPDKETGDTEKYHAISQAYETLSDPEKREHYDDTGSTEDKPKSTAEMRLAEIFNYLISKELFDGNIIDQCLVQSEKIIQQINGQILNHVQHTTRLEKQLGRIKAKDNIYENVLEDQIRSISNALSQCQKEIDINQEVKKLLREYTDTAINEPKPMFVIRGSQMEVGTSSSWYSDN